MPMEKESFSTSELRLESPQLLFICIQTDTFRTAICHDKINLKQMVILTKPLIIFAGLIK